MPFLVFLDIEKGQVSFKKELDEYGGNSRGINNNYKCKKTCV